MYLVNKMKPNTFIYLNERSTLTPGLGRVNIPIQRLQQFKIKN